MCRTIKDAEYITYLRSDIYREHYYAWRARMLTSVDDIAMSLEESPIEEVMSNYNLSPRDVALLVRLGFFDDNEVERFGLKRIEMAVPL